jgi:dTDP-4-dehydrorhamnose 3,5-epimerase-like enzyme
VFKPESDTGIHWDSCGIDWPNKNPIISEKDANMIGLDEFKSPF